MRSNVVREKLRSGQHTFGSFMGMGSPTIAELLAHAGCEWLLIEMEHNGLDMAEVEHILMAMNGTETVPLVRIPSIDPVFIQRALDIGGMGLMVPMVRTADEARAIVRASRYPPEGSRSFGPLRASQYTVNYEEYFNRANENVLIRADPGDRRGGLKIWRRLRQCRASTLSLSAPLISACRWG